MNVSLTPELEKWVESRVQSGLYASSSEVVRAALRMLVQEEQARTQSLTSLREAVEEGLEDLRAGRVVPFDDDFVENVKRMSRQRKG